MADLYGFLKVSTVLVVLLGAHRCSAARFAVCLTGQLPRLELGTKVENLLVANLAAGHDIALFVRLSNESKKSSGTISSSHLYTSFAEAQLENFISHHVSTGGNSGNSYAGIFHVSVVYDTTSHPTYFEPFKGIIPVDQLNGETDGSKRFTLNFIMLTQVRACMRSVAAHEVQTRAFFDYVIRLRDDSYVFAKWSFQPALYAGAISDIKPGSWGGLNDHTLVVDRLYADVMLRGPVEDYYLNNTETGTHFKSTEGLLMTVAKTMGVPIRILSVCSLPLVTLRGLASNKDAWILHKLYAHQYFQEIVQQHEDCSAHTLTESTIPLHPVDAQVLVQRTLSRGRSRLEESEDLLHPSITSEGAPTEYWRRKPNQPISFVHIPKTGGQTLMKELDVLFKKRPEIWQKPKFNSERCKNYFPKNHFLTVLLRSPRAVVLSQFLECKHDTWGKRLTKRWDAFPHSRHGAAGDADDFGDWVRHFTAPAWVPRGNRSTSPTNDFGCYSPQNLQTRQLSTECHGNPHHVDAHHGGWPMTPEWAAEAVAVLSDFDFVGLQDWWELSLCLLRYSLRVKLPERCFNASSDATELTGVHIRHGLPPTGPIAAVVPPAVWSLVDDMTSYDLHLFAVARSRLMADFDAFQRSAKQGGNLQLSSHLLEQHNDLSYITFRKS